MFNKKKVPLSLKQISWEYWGVTAYHRTYLSACKQWVCNSPLTRYGLIQITSDPIQEIQLRSCIEDSQMTIDGLFIYHSSQMYYWQLNQHIETMIPLLAPSFSQFEHLSNLKNASFSKLHPLSCLELSAIEPHLNPPITLKRLYEERNNSRLRSIKNWRRNNPTIPVFELEENWITTYGGRQASDIAIESLIRGIFSRTGELLLNACGYEYVLKHGNTELDIDIDIDLLLRPDSFQGDLRLPFKASTQELESFLNYWEEPHRKPITVSTIRTLLYLISYIPYNPPQAFTITDHLIHVLHFLRKKNLPVNTNVFTILSEICAQEKQPFDFTNVYARYEIYQVVNGIYATPLMYYVQSGQLKQVKSILNATPHLLVRNSETKNVLELALELPIVRQDVLLHLLIKMAYLNPEEQRNLLQKIEKGRYSNVFRFTADKFPNNFQLLSQHDHWDTWADELNYCLQALDTLKTLHLNQDIAYFETALPDSTFLTQLKGIRLTFLLSQLPIEVSKQRLTEECLLTCDRILKNQSPYLEPSTWSNVYRFFNPAANVLARLNQFKDKYQDIINNQSDFVIVTMEHA